MINSAAQTNYGESTGLTPFDKPRSVCLSINGAVGNAASSDPAASDDGRYVAYASDASNLVPGDTNNTTNVSVYGRINRATTRASVGTTGDQGTGRNPSISRNGQQVAFQSAAANLIGQGGHQRVRRCVRRHPYRRPGPRQSVQPRC